jgi:adenylyltransferase/sulfurtransferase
MLSEIQIERYSRQIILPQLGGKGQEKLLNVRVLVNGAGLLQTTALLYLAAAGVGTIGVRAHGTLPVFCAFTVRPAGDRLSEVAATLSRLNPDCTVVQHACSSEQATASSASSAEMEQLIQGYDLVLSEPDPLLDQCYASGRPFCCSWGQATERRLFVSNGGSDLPCFQCIPAEQRLLKTADHPTDHQVDEFADEFADESARFDLLASLFWGAFQATEALKCIIGLSVDSHPRVFQCQFPDLQFSEQPVYKDPHCSSCSVPGQLN